MVLTVPRFMWIDLSVLCALTVLIRGYFVLETSALPFFAVPTPGLDADIYWRAAASLGAERVGPVFELMSPTAPLFVYFLSLIQSVLGMDMESYRMFQAFFSCIFIVW